MTQRPDLSILIVSFNTCEMTLACIESVYAQTRDAAFEVIVVDNASADGSADAIAAKFPAVRLIRPGRNLGFAGANNEAARHAAGQYVLLLNPDTVVLDGAIDRMVAFARAHPDAGAVGGRTLYDDRSLNATSCFGLPSMWSLFCQGTGLSAILPQSELLNPEEIGGWRRDTVREVGVITGCFLLIPRTLWEQLDGFDPSFFMYSEDTDLSHRVWRSGYKCMHCPDAVIIHYGGQSEVCRAGKLVKVFRAKAQYMRKHWRPVAAFFGTAMLDLWALTRAAGYGLLRCTKPSARATCEQWAEVWRRRREWHELPANKPQAAHVVTPNSGPSAAAGSAKRTGLGLVRSE